MLPGLWKNGGCMNKNKVSERRNNLILWKTWVNICSPWLSKQYSSSLFEILHNSLVFVLLQTQIPWLQMETHYHQISCTPSTYKEFIFLMLFHPQFTLGTRYKQRTIRYELSSLTPHFQSWSLRIRDNTKTRPTAGMTAHSRAAEAKTKHLVLWEKRTSSSCLGQELKIKGWRRFLFKLILRK
jgi:hypothetical protein